MPRKIAVVIPCLNEASTIASLVAEVRKFVPAIFIVDDGSADETALLAEQAGAKVLRNETPQGKGAALTRGWKHTWENGFEWVLSMDGDGQHTPQDIPGFLELEGAELFVGNRMGNANAMPPLRRNINRWMSQRISSLAGCDLPDTQCGFRLMNLKAWSQIQITARHFEIESEVLLKFLAAEKAVRFVPVQVIYRTERSKIRPLRDTIRWFRWLQAARRDFSEAKLKFKMESTRALT